MYTTYIHDLNELPLKWLSMTTQPPHAGATQKKVLEVERLWVFHDAVNCNKIFVLFWVTRTASR